jgi:hypothetical protein
LNLATPLAQGNHAQRHGQHAQAIRHYAAGLRDDAQASAHGPIAAQLAHNLRRARQGYRRQRQAQLQAGGKLQVVVCCWSLSENPAGRADTLASLYHDLAAHPEPPPAPGIERVSLIGSVFARRGYQLWAPLRELAEHGPIPIHSILIEDERAFMAQAIDLVSAHPADLVHLVKPRWPNILFGLLEPDGQIKLPPHVRHQEPVSVLITFLDEPVSVPGEASAAVTLALLRSPAFQSLPTSDPNEIEQRIADLRNDWNDD